MLRKCGFPTSVMTQHGNELSLPYCERDALERELRLRTFDGRICVFYFLCVNYVIVHDSEFFFIKKKEPKKKAAKYLDASVYGSG